MKNLFKLLTVNAGFLFLFLIGCQEIETLPVDLVENENDIHYVDINQATMIASTIEFPVKSSPKRKSEKGISKRFEIELLGSKKIKESFSTLGKDNKAVYHTINYEEGGFVIIAGDNRIPPIMAFSYDNSLPIEENTEYPEGLLDWFKTQKEWVEFVRENDFSDLKNGEELDYFPEANLWDPCPIQRLIYSENMSYDPCDPNGGGGCEDQYTQVGPLLATTWDQGCDLTSGNGYNQLMPNLSCSPQCGRAYAGCVPVAIAQVMRYHSHPQGYNYANMPNNAGNINNATLIADIFNAFPSSQQTISCSGTGITAYVPGGFGTNFSSLFTSSFGYSSAIRAQYDFALVRGNLNLGRPVILDGDGTFGHMWVTDGYLRAVFCSGQTLLKLHMNWGWGGDGNGFFNYDNFTVTTSTGTKSFNQDKYMVYNIIP